MTLGEKIKAERKRIGLTQEQLADKLCVSRQAIQKWESDNGVPSIENLKAISQLFEISIDSLVADEEAPIEEDIPEVSASEVQSEEESPCQEMKTCPQCGAENLATSNFCKRCGYGFLSDSEAPKCETVQPETTQPERKKISAAEWFKANLKLIIPLAVFLVVVIVVCALIPTFISLSKKRNQLSGTYYSYEDGEYDTSESIIFKDQTWEMKDSSVGSGLSLSGTYKKTDDEIVFYYAGIEFFYGTLNEDLLTLKNTSGETTVLCKKGHKHDFDEWVTSEPSCSLNGFEYHTCYCGFMESRTIPATSNHTLGAYTAAKEATCTKNGNVGYYRCSVCQKYFSDDKGKNEIDSITIPATGNHTLGAYTAEKKATCTINGNVGYYRCSVCKKYFSDDKGKNEIDSITIPATGHTEGEWKVIKEATCGEVGTKALSCTVCKTQLKSSVIDATGAHSWEAGACKICESTQVEYRLSSDGEYYIVKGLSNAAKNCKEIEILASYHGLPVKAIGGDAFSECAGLTKVILPEGITEIGEDSFYACDGLTEINIPDSVTIIKRGAFRFCSGLTEVILPDGMETLEAMAFYYCENLQSIEVPDSVTDIGSLAFGFCSSLTSFKVPCNLKKISDSMFKDSGLTSIEIPDSVTLIDAYAFSGCDSMKSITIGSGVKSIEDFAFSRCHISDGVYIKDLKAWFEISFSNLLTSTPLSRTNGLYLNGELITELVVPDGVTVIKGNVFYGYARLMGVRLSESVISIEGAAFYGCDNLKSVYLGGGLTSLAANAFYDCKNLECLTVNESNQTFSAQDGILYNKDKTVIKLIPQNLQGEVAIADGVTSIGELEFSRRSGLTGVTIPKSITFIDDFAFSNCTDLESITILSDDITISNRAFTSTKYYKDENNWQNGILYIGNHLIEAKTSISGECRIKDGTVTIQSHSFEYCKEVTVLVIPDSVKTIENSAFRYCTGLTSVTIGRGVTSMKSDAFYECSSLKNVYITDLALWFGILIEGGATGATNPLHRADNLYVNGELVTELVIPDGVTAIQDNAFYFFSGLTSVRIGTHVTLIGECAFYYSSLKHVYYDGTKEDWEKVEKGAYWDYKTVCTVHCTDGDIE